jgi:2-methylcitrate dehydratase PrpD
MHETRTLAQFVRETRYEDLPASLIDDGKIATLDTVGAAFVGTAQPWARTMVAMVHDLGGTPDATVIHYPWQTDMARAALANGALIGAFECEPLTGSHASGTVLPAALAVSQREHLSGQAFLTALALGFEIQARIARTAVGLEAVRGFHNPGTQGPFGAAVATGKLYDFATDTLTSALGLAGSCSAGLLEFAWTGADTKRIHLGRASQLGLESALLAHRGLQGPPTVLEGRYGYYNAFSEPTDPAQLVEGLGSTWIMQPSSLKSFATHVTHQSVVQAIQEWKQTHTVDPQAITRIAIHGAQRIMEARHAVRDPHNVMGGQYSLPFTTAVALTRDMDNPLVYNDEAVHDPVVRDLAQRIELIPDDTAQIAHGVFPSTVLIEHAGQSYTLPTQPHKGSPRNPMTWDDACTKFRRFTRELISTAQADAIIAAVGDLENMSDIATFAALLRQADN